MYSGKVTLTAMYLRRFRIAGLCFAAALTHVPTVVTPPAPAAKKNSAWDSGGLAGGRRVAAYWGDGAFCSSAARQAAERLYGHTLRDRLAFINSGVD